MALTTTESSKRGRKRARWIFLVFLALVLPSCGVYSTSPGSLPGHIKTLAVPANLVYHEVATDNVVFVVHPSNNVPSLNKQQIKSILTGKVANWKELKGPDVMVKVLAPAQGQAVRSAVEKVVLEGAAFGPGTTDVRTALEQLKLTANEPGAIAPYSEAVVKESSEKLRVVPGTVIRRPLGFVTIGAASGDTKKMIDFFRSPEGKKAIK